MAVKKNTYIDVELDWAEQQLSSWKEYVDANPLHTLKDRIEWKPTAKGGMLPMVIASNEKLFSSSEGSGCNERKTRS